MKKIYIGIIILILSISIINFSINNNELKEINKESSENINIDNIFNNMSGSGFNVKVESINMDISLEDYILENKLISRVKDLYITLRRDIPNKEELVKLSSIFKSFYGESLRIDFKYYSDDYSYVFSNLKSTEIKNIVLDFGYNYDNGLENTLKIIKNKINNFGNINNIFLFINGYELNNNEIQILKNIEIDTLGFGGISGIFSENYYNNIEEIINESLFIKKIIIQDYGEFKKIDGEVIFTKE